MFQVQIFPISQCGQQWLRYWINGSYLAYLIVLSIVAFLADSLADSFSGHSEGTHFADSRFLCARLFVRTICLRAAGVMVGSTVRSRYEDVMLVVCMLMGQYPSSVFLTDHVPRVKELLKIACDALAEDELVSKRVRTKSNCALWAIWLFQFAYVEWMHDFVGLPGTIDSDVFSVFMWLVAKRRSNSVLRFGRPRANYKDKIGKISMSKNMNFLKRDVLYLAKLCGAPLDHSILNLENLRTMVLPSV